MGILSLNNIVSHSLCCIIFVCKPLTWLIYLLYFCNVLLEINFLGEDSNWQGTPGSKANWRRKWKKAVCICLFLFHFTAPALCLIWYCVSFWHDSVDSLVNEIFVFVHGCKVAPFWGSLVIFLFWFCAPKKCPILLLQLNDFLPSQIDGPAEGRKRGREESQGKNSSEIGRGQGYHCSIPFFFLPEISVVVKSICASLF